VSSLIPIQATAAQHDLTGRYVYTQTIVASPTGSSETIVASIAIPTGIQILSGVQIEATAWLTVGGTCTSDTIRIRQTGLTGTTVANSGALTTTAGNLISAGVAGFDTGPVAGQVYKMTLTMGAAGNTSTVSAVFMRAWVF
jgi:hypothetical protein